MRLARTLGSNTLVGPAPYVCAGREVVQNRAIKAQNQATHDAAGYAPGYFV